MADDFKPKGFPRLGRGSGIPKQMGENALNNFSGVVSTKPSAKYMSGARCTLRANGRIVAFAFEVSWTIRTEGKEVWGIDYYVPQEIVPNRIMVTGTMSGFRIPERGPSSELLQSDVMSFLFFPYITLEVRDSKTDQLLFYAERVQVVQRTEIIRAEQLAQLRVDWHAIGWQDDKPPSTNAGEKKSLVNQVGQKINNMRKKILG